LAIGVWIELRAIAWIVDHLLRHCRAGECGRKDRRGGENFGFCHGALRCWCGVSAPSAHRSGVRNPAESNRRDADQREGAALRFWLCGLQTGVKFRLFII
jgi:hypothetical protein